MSSENKDIPEDEVEAPIVQEDDGAELESADVETDELSEVEAPKKRLRWPRTRRFVRRQMP